MYHTLTKTTSGHAGSIHHDASHLPYLRGGGRNESEQANFLALL